MGLFSGDGAGLASRLMKKYGAHIIGGLHIKMPDCICDVKTLKRSISQNRELIKDATNKLIKAAHQLKENRPPQEGINVFYHIAGLLGQRLWFYNKTRSYTDQLHIDPNACICCGSGVFKSCARYIIKSFFIKWFYCALGYQPHITDF